MRAFHLFTAAGVPVYISPFYLLLLFLFARGDAMRGVIWGVGITLSLLVHEFGHALTARYLRHQPSIMLHGFGGLTSRERQGRDVEEAAIIAMGPAAGLALGLVVGGVWLVLVYSGSGQVLLSRPVFEAFQSVIYPCIAWNFLNLLPLWPLDGGQLLRLGAIRVLGVKRAQWLTHGLAMALVAVFLFLLIPDGGMFTMVLLGMLGLQNWQALRSSRGAGEAPVTSAHNSELVQNARAALDEQRYQDAVRFAHQARAVTNLPASQLDEVWEILGVATAALGEPEEALRYLRRAPPTTLVREATEHCLREVGAEEDIVDVAARWQAAARGRNIGRVLVGALAFIVVAAVIVFSTPLSRHVF